MTGIFLIFVVVCWFFYVCNITEKIVKKFKSELNQVIICILVFPVLFVIPVADEIVGKYQFNSLCEKYAVMEVDEKNAMNRNVFLQRRKEDFYAKGTVLKIRIDPYMYKDSITDRVVVSYNILHAEGGLLIRLMGISETNSPLTFNARCEPKDSDTFEKRFNIKVIN